MAKQTNRQLKQMTVETVADYEKRKPILKALMDATRDKPRGFLLTKEDAIKIAGGEKEFKKHSLLWRLAILWTRGITVEWDHNAKGYRLLDVERHMTVRNARVMWAAEKRHANEALRLSLIHDGDMENDHQRRLRVLLAQQHSDTAGKIAGQREATRVALMAPETLPQAKIG